MTGDGEQGRPAGGFDGALDHLPRILASHSFRNAPRSREFLAFVVTEAAAGRGDRLSERHIGELGPRGRADFDPRMDPNVRIRAGRVRAALDAYYAHEGRDDPVRIVMPVGQYRPELRPAPPRVHLGSDVEHTHPPVVAVAAFDDNDTSQPDRVAALELADGLVHALAHCPGISVVGPVTLHSSSSGARTGLAARTGASFALHGTVRRIGGEVRVTVTLASTADEHVLWSESFDQTADDTYGFEMSDEMMAAIVGAVGDFRGVVLTEAPHTGTSPRAVADDAVRSYHAYIDDLHPARTPDTVAALERAAEVAPDDPAVIAALGSVYAIDVLLRGPGAAADSLARAQELGRAAAALDPSDPNSHFVLGVVAVARGDRAGATSHARAILASTPHHPSLTYRAGALLVADRWDEGIAVIRRAIRSSPRQPRHRHVFVAIDDIARGDLAAALAEASLLRFAGFVWGPLLRAICLLELGMSDAARDEVADLVRVSPGFFDDPRAVIGASPNVPGFAVELLAGYAPRLDRLRLPAPPPSPAAPGRLDRPAARG